MNEPIELTPGHIEAYKELLNNPSSHGFTFRKLTECFKESSTVIPKHELYKIYIDYLQKPLPKIVFYIIMDEIYGNVIDKDETSGNLGYKLEFVDI